MNHEESLQALTQCKSDDVGRTAGDVLERAMQHDYPAAIELAAARDSLNPTKTTASAPTNSPPH